MNQKSGYEALSQSRATGGGAADGGVAAADAPFSGAPPSNRAPDSCNRANYQLLSRHVDSLELSYQGVMHPVMMRRLADLKILAQSRSNRDVSRAQIVLGDQLFAVQDKGYGRHKYILDGDFCRLTLSDSEQGKIPFAFCQIRNIALMSHGPRAAEALVCALLPELGELQGEAMVSRMDLAVDFATSDDMEAWDRLAWVTRMPHKSKYAVGDQHSGWKLMGSSTGFGIYDKTLEIMRSGKLYMHEVWERAGHVPWDTVWRVEARFWRQYLHQFYVQSLPRALEVIPALWARFLTETLRLTVPNPRDETRSRWPEHPLCSFLRGVDWGVPFTPLCRMPSASGAPSRLGLGKFFAGVLTSSMARQGFEEPEDAIPFLKECVREYLQDACAVTGLTPEELLYERARVKGRRYGTMCNVESGRPATPLTRAAAELAYRKASQGE